MSFLFGRGSTHAVPEPEQVIAKLRNSNPEILPWVTAYVGTIIQRGETSSSNKSGAVTTFPAVQSRWRTYRRRYLQDDRTRYPDDMAIRTLVSFGFVRNRRFEHEVSDRSLAGPLKGSWIERLYVALQSATPSQAPAPTPTVATPAPVAAPPIPVRSSSIRTVAEATCLVRNVTELERLKAEAVQKALKQCAEENEKIINELKQQIASLKLAKDTSDETIAKLDALKMNNAAMPEKVTQATKPQSLLDQIQAGKTLKKTTSAAPNPKPASNSLEDALRARIAKVAKGTQAPEDEDQQEESDMSIKSMLIGDFVQGLLFPMEEVPAQEPSRGETFYTDPDTGDVRYNPVSFAYRTVGKQPTKAELEEKKQREMERGKLTEAPYKAGVVYISQTGRATPVVSEKPKDK